MNTYRALFVAATLALAAGCGGESSPDPVQQARAERAGSAAVTVALPVGWHSTTWDDGNVIDPVTRVVVASAPVRPKATACQVAQYDFAADAVALVVLEWRMPSPTLPERPARFTDDELPVQPQPAIECFEGSGGSAQFIDHGRSFGAYLLVGPDAPASLVDEARRVLDTLRVTERHGDAAERSLERKGAFRCTTSTLACVSARRRAWSDFDPPRPAYRPRYCGQTDRVPSGDIPEPVARRSADPANRIVGK